MYHSCIISKRNKFFLRAFNGIVQVSLYHDMYTCTIRYCALVNCTPSQSVGLFFKCALFQCWVSLCIPFTNSLIYRYFIMIVAIIIIEISMAILLILISIFRLSATRWLWFCRYAPSPGCFCPWTFSLNIGLSMLHSVSIISCMEYLHFNAKLAIHRIFNQHPLMNASGQMGRYW